MHKGIAKFYKSMIPDLYFVYTVKIYTACMCILYGCTYFILIHVHTFTYPRLSTKILSL